MYPARRRLSDDELIEWIRDWWQHGDAPSGLVLYLRAEGMAVSERRVYRLWDTLKLDRPLRYIRLGR